MYKIEFIKKVIAELSRFNIKGDVAIFIACQFALESSFGLSKLVLNNHNYCGMKLPLVRRSTALNFGSGDAWSKYSNLRDCVCDYVLCLMYHRPMSCDFDSVTLFSHFINGWYCPEKSYLDKINSLYVQFQNLLKNGN